MNFREKILGIFKQIGKNRRKEGMKNLNTVLLTAGFLWVLLTAQSAAFVRAQSITAATPFEQLAQGQGQPATAAPTAATRWSDE
jgi:hypothetical protein